MINPIFPSIPSEPSHLLEAFHEKDNCESNSISLDETCEENLVTKNDAVLCMQHIENSINKPQEIGQLENLQHVESETPLKLHCNISSQSFGSNLSKTKPQTQLISTINSLESSNSKDSFEHADCQSQFSMQVNTGMNTPNNRTNNNVGLNYQHLGHGNAYSQQAYPVAHFDSGRFNPFPPVVPARKSSLGTTTGMNNSNNYNHQSNKSSSNFSLPPSPLLSSLIKILNLSTKTHSTDNEHSQNSSENLKNSIQPTLNCLDNIVKDLISSYLNLEKNNHFEKYERFSQISLPKLNQNLQQQTQTQTLTQTQTQTSPGLGISIGPNQHQICQQISNNSENNNFSFDSVFAYSHQASVNERTSSSGNSFSTSTPGSAIQEQMMELEIQILENLALQYHYFWGCGNACETSRANLSIPTCS